MVREPVSIRCDYILREWKIYGGKRKPIAKAVLDYWDKVEDGSGTRAHFTFSLGRMKILDTCFLIDLQRELHRGKNSE